MSNIVISPQSGVIEFNNNSPSGAAIGSATAPIRLDATGGNSFITGGNFGVGMTAPTAALHVYGDGGTAAKVENGSLKIRYPANNDSITITPSVGNEARILAADVDTSSPHPLKIAGDYVRFTTSGSSPNTEVVRITADGKVGIGITDPDAFLDVSRDNSNAGNQFVVADTEGTSAAIRTYTHGGSPAGLILNHYYAEGGSSNEYARYADFVSNVGNGAGTKMRFITKNAANTYFSNIINNSGWLGIGTDDPLGKLHVYNTAKTSDGDGTATMTATGQDSIVLYGHGGVDEATYGGITWMGGSTRRRAMITAVAENTDTDFVGLAFYTQGTDGAGDFSESMRITRDGDVGIGTTEVNAGIGLQVANGGLYVTNGTARLKHVDAQYFGNGTELKLSAGQSADLKLMHYNTVDVTVKSDGKVGIGTTGPSGVLDVGGDGADIFLHSNDYKIARIQPRGTSTNYDRGLFSLFNQTVEAVRIDSYGPSWFNSEAGNHLGIGTVSPNKQVEIRATEPYLRLEESSSGGNKRLDLFVSNSTGVIGANQSAQTMMFQTVGENRMTIRAGGNVGIGTTNPSDKLEVQNNVGNPMMHLRPNAASTALNPIILYRNQLNGSANYMLCQGTNTFFGTYNGGAPTDESEMIRLAPSSSDAPSIRIGDAGSTSSYLQVGGNVYLSNNSSSYINGGDVGIGTATPAQKLHLEFSNTDTSFAGGGGGSWGSEGLLIENTSSTADTMAIIQLRNGDSDFHIAGIRQGTDDSDLGFFSEGSEKVRFTHDGNVGIGTVSPADTLQVAGQVRIDGSTTDGLTITSSAGASQGLLIYNNSNTDTANIINYYNGPLLLGQNNTEVITIDNDSVGINVAAPAGDKLMVQAENNYFAARLDGSTTAGQSRGLRVRAGYNSSDFPVLIEKGDGTDIFIIDGLGNVGIGSASPAYKLDVDGTIHGTSGNFETAITINGNPVVTGSSASEGDTLATVTARGATTSSNLTLNGDITVASSKYIGIGSTLAAIQFGDGSVGNETADLSFVTNSDGEITFTRGSNAAIIGADFNIYKDTNISAGHLRLDDTYKIEWGGTNARIDGSNSSDYLRFFTSNTERIRIVDGGNVGIGTTDPFLKFYVDGNSRVEGNLMVGDAARANTPAAALHIKSSSTNARLRIEDSDNANQYWDFFVDQGDGLSINEDTDTRLFLKEGGNVGIGTTNPVQKLQVNGSIYAAGGHFYVDNDKSLTSVGDLQLKTNNGTTAVFIDTSQNVGIGTTDPSQKLEIIADATALADQPAEPLFVHNNGNNIDGRVFLSVKHDRISTAQALGAGLKMTAGAVTAGTASYFDSLIFLEGAAAGSDTIHSAPKAIKFYVDNHGTAAGDGTNYSQLGDLRLTIAEDGNIGIGDATPIGDLQIGTNVFSGANGVHADDRIGLSVNGSLKSIVYASTYNNATYPDYGMVFIHGPNTGDYNVWSISPDGPAKGSGLNFIYRKDTTNIHTTDPKVYFNGDGKVGIGTTDPLGTTHIYTADAGGAIVTNASHDDLIIENNGNCGIQLSSPSSSYQYLAFGDTASANAGYVRYYHSDDSMVLRAGANDTVTIKGGNVGIGLTEPSHLLSVGTIGNANGKKITTYLGGSDEDYSAIGGQRGQANAYCSSEIRFINEDNSAGKGAIAIAAGTNTLSEHLRVTSAGNVGIGTNNPPHKLSVKGTISRLNSSNIQVINLGVSSEAGQLTINNAGGVTKALIDSNGESYLNGGNVGIGLTDPDTLLEVAGVIKSSSTSRVQADTYNNSANSANIIYRSSSKTIVGNNASALVILDGGNVGIGSTDPDYTLTVDAGTTNEIARFRSTDNDALISISDNTDTVYIGHDAALDVMSLGFNNSMGTSSNLNITTAGYVGIGTNAASYPLVIRTAGDGIKLDVTDGVDANFRVNVNGAVTEVGPSTANFALMAGGAERVRIDANGVGIGTNNPSYDLHVEGEILAESNMLLGGDGTYGTTYGAIGIGTTNLTNGHHRIFAKSTDHMYFAASSSKGFRFRPNGGATSATDGITIDSNGRLGIGITNPANKLDVGGGVAIGASYVGTSAPSNGAIIQGNVGIGTTSVSYALQVNGSIVGSYKSFLIDHPTKEGKQLMHSCIEGPEHAVYFRGKSNLNVIKMPDYWEGLVDLDTMTVELTAIGANQNIYVDSIAENGEVTVGSNTDEPLNYFYVVYGERKDIDKLETEIIKPQYAD